MRIWAGFPCPVSALPRIPFNKPPLGLPAQLSLLQSRGLTIGDPAAADHYLKHIGYYRLSGYALPHPVLASWLHSLNYVRNVCAHHGRLWNRECRIKPLIARAYKAELTPNDRVYAQMVVMQILLALIAPGNHWAGKLRELLAEHPRVPATAMGFPAGWASRRIWGLTP
jgi:abortive infection bacteriophage resistance protein